MIPAAKAAGFFILIRQLKRYLSKDDAEFVVKELRW